MTKENGTHQGVDQDQRKYVSTSVAMKIMGISSQALWKQVEAGKLDKFKRGRDICYLREQVKGYKKIRKVS